MINFDAVDLSEYRSEEVMFLLTLSVITQVRSAKHVFIIVITRCKELLLCNVHTQAFLN